LIPIHLTNSPAPPYPFLSDPGESMTTLSIGATKALESFPRLIPPSSRFLYIERLRSFKPSLYFAKPVGLGPQDCARWGYACTGVDELTCTYEKCKACVVVRIDDALGEEESGKLADAFREKLKEAHVPFCPCR